MTLTTTTPSGWATPDPITIIPTGSATLTITVPSTTNPTSYPVTITGTDGTNPKTITLTVQVPKPDFSLTANPTSLSIRHGNSGKSTITVTSIGGYTGSTTLSASGMPTGMTATFSTNPVKAGSSSTMTLITSRTTAPGTYTITVTGTNSAAGLTHTTTISVTVT